jgi:alkylhydroperoxidase/carboxymuconolactone decarboxylase family protein YurZ
MSEGKDIVRAMREARGYLYPEWEWAIEQDADFAQAYDTFYRQALGKEAGLPVKDRERVALGILAFRGVADEALMNHIRRAYQHGATPAEVLGALEATAVPGGAVTFLNGLRALTKVERGET